MQDFEPLDLMKVLAEHDVRYVVIGGVAAAAHGSPSLTGDLDICYDRDRDNLERLAAALRTVRARLRGVTDDVPFLLDAKTLEAGDHFTFETDAGDFDLMATPSGISGFEDLAVNAVPMDFGGYEVLVASLDDLIAMKRAAGRAKDRIELEILGGLRRELEAE